MGYFHMLNIRYLCAVFLMLCLGLSHAVGARYADETLHYVISYKWGLIHKDAGEATLTLRNRGSVYDVMLTARTKPWADRIYQVRDTLKGTIAAQNLRPLSYLKLTHEKGEFKKDEIKYTVTGETTSAIARRYRNENGRMSVKEISLSASGPVFDMLSVFYYLRQLDFKAMEGGKSYSATVFSGKRKEKIKIQLLGVETIKLKDKSRREAYHIRFNFTRDGGKKSSDDMDTWISTGPERIPLYLVGKLPVGEIRAYLVD